MVGIDNEYQVGALLAQPRIVDATEQCLDIVDAALAFTTLDLVEHLLLNVDGVHDAVRDPLGDTKAEVARTRADIRDGMICFDWQRLDQDEIERGEAKGKVREKYTSVGDMMDAIGRLREGSA